MQTEHEKVQADSLVVATGGLSIPKIGATDFGYRLARQFGLPVTDVRAGLVPLTFSDSVLAFCKALTGLSVDAMVSCSAASFREGLLFTHRGLSGPSVLQISSYWQIGEKILIDLAPDMHFSKKLQEVKLSQGKSDILTVMAKILPRRLAAAILEREGVSGRIANLTSVEVDRLYAAVHR